MPDRLEGGSAFTSTLMSLFTRDFIPRMFSRQPKSGNAWERVIHVLVRIVF